MMNAELLRQLLVCHAFESPVASLSSSKRVECDALEALKASTEVFSLLVSHLPSVVEDFVVALPYCFAKSWTHNWQTD